MRFAVATIADAGSVREGLLHVLGAGVTRVYAHQFPIRVHTVFAAIVEIGPGEPEAAADVSVPVTLRIVGIEDDHEYMAAEGLMVPSEAEKNRRDDIPTSVPFVIPMAAAEFAKSGLYRIEVKAGTLETTVLFSVSDPPVDP